MIGALVTLARPRLLPFVLLLPVVGFGFAHWSTAAPLQPGEASALGRVAAAWALLHAGTMWLNAARDRDHGEVLYGTAVEVPRGTAAIGLLALGGTLLLAAPGPPAVVVAAVGCVALSVAYSSPRGAWKAHPVGGPVVNGVGYGLLSPLAGWACAATPADARAVAAWLLGAAGILGVYFAAQAFQAEEDRARGDRTLVAVHGPGAALLAARVGIGAAFVGGVTLVVAGWFPPPLVLLVVVGWQIDRYLRAWASLPGGGDEAWARGLARRLGWGALVGVLLVFADYAADSLRGGPVAGLSARAPWWSW